MPVSLNITKDIPIPDGITVNYKNSIISVKGAKGTLERKFEHPKIQVSVNKGVVKVECPLARKNEAALCGTWAAHINNMIKGVSEGWEYHMKVVYSHFPIKTKVDKNKNLLVIENFLGEKTPRMARICDGIDVKVQGENIVITGIDIEKVGQTAANIEKAAYIKGYDPKVFQDGIYITKKAHED